MCDFNSDDLSSNHKYRTELPNIIFELGLTSIQFFVYCAIKKSAGDHGGCTKSTKTLAKICNCSVRTIHKTIQELSEINNFIKKPLILCTHRISEWGDKDTNLITIVDVWEENYLIKGGSAKSAPPSEISALPSAKSTVGVAQNLRQGSAKSAHKQEPIKKNPYEEEQQQRLRQTIVQPVVVFFDILKKDERLTDENRLALMRFTEDRVKLAIEFSHKVTPTKSLIQQLVWHSSQEIPPKIPKSSFWEEFRKHFKNNSEHNGATCYINEEKAAFSRGMTHREVFINKPNSRKEIEDILASFGIRWSYE